MAEKGFITFRIDDKTKKQLKTIADEEQCPRSQLIRKAVVEFVRRRQRQPVSAK